MDPLMLERASVVPIGKAAKHAENAIYPSTFAQLLHAPHGRAASLSKRNRVERSDHFPHAQRESQGSAVKESGIVPSALTRSRAK
jgi:hypothetical protein